MNVPIISCFVEIKDTNKQEKLHPEFNKTRWILHVHHPVDNDFIEGEVSFYDYF